MLKRILFSLILIAFSSASFAGETTSCRYEKKSHGLRDWGNRAMLLGAIVGGMVVMSDAIGRDTAVARGSAPFKLHVKEGAITAGVGIGTGLALRARANHYERICAEEQASASDLVNAPKFAPGSALGESAKRAVRELVAATAR